MKRKEFYKKYKFPRHQKNFDRGLKNSYEKKLVKVSHLVLSYLEV